MEVADTLKALKMDPVEKKLRGIIIDHMYTCIEEGIGLKHWMDHLASMDICVHTTLPDLIRSSIGMGKQKTCPSDPDKITVETNFGQVYMSHETAEKIMTLGYIPLPEKTK
jgi:hypothetical protein